MTDIDDAPYEFSYLPADRGVECRVVFVRSPSQAELRRAIPGFSRGLVVIDEKLKERPITRKVLNALRACGNLVGLVELRGEKKDFKKLKTIWQAAIRRSPDLLISIGGGTLCDLTGFTAATYLRGIPHILFPTTTLAMVDASIGGKTAIDFGGLKNSVGAVHYPPMVINVTSFLRTLPRPELISGLAEVVKVAVVSAPDLIERLYERSTLLQGRPGLTATRLLFDAAVAKARICEERTEGAKLKLLYGHAVGHALEILGPTARRHGDCVAIGMQVEGAIGVLLGTWTIDCWEAQRRVLAHLGLPLALPDEASGTRLIRHMSLYRRLMSRDEFLLALPSAIGVMHKRSSGFATRVSRTTFSNLLAKARRWEYERASFTEGNDVRNPGDR